MANKIQLGAFKNNLYNGRVEVSGLCQRLIRLMEEWQKADAGCFMGFYKDSKAYKNLEEAVIHLRSAERELIDTQQHLNEEIEHYGES